MLRLLLMTLLCGGFSAASHSLRYFYTAVSPVPDVPEFVTVGYVDEEPIDYYDSETRRTVPRQQWMEKSQGPDYWEGETQNLRGDEQVFKANIQILEERTNQTGGVHTYQVMYGCELRDDGSISGFCQFGWDGDDLISFDKDQEVWVTPVTWGQLTKYKWDRDTAMIQDWKIYLEQTCITWLKKYVQAGQAQHKPGVSPEVSFTSSADGRQLACKATGFYPQAIDVTLLQDDRVLGETRSHGILPNHDGTYQLTRRVEVDPSDPAQFSCRIEHRGLDEPLLLFLDRKAGPPVLIIVVVVVLLILVAITVIGGFIWWKKKAGSNGYNPTKTSEKGESSSNSSATA
ncbi:class I histocompatibility antigen, F10 alpha chain-like [Narcine bancroftii]|uniref:class I histocompatibility antigen, F10 alpha chain-like n=1 Tax=Narcine bancroftii TaxID=1343680 RepID=UPI0038315EE2